MPAAIIEFYKSRALNLNTQNADEYKHERNYRVTQTTDDVEALTLLIATAPTSVTLAGVALAKAEYSIADADYGVFEGSVVYSKRSRKENGESTYSFETAASSLHITHSRQTIQAVGGNINDNQRAIGFDGDTVQGTDIFVPVYNFNESHPIAAALITPAYKAALFRATGKVNNANFKGFNAGEVLFLGASGQQKADTWDIDYRFAASENATGLAIGALTGINKKGWEYLWCTFREETVGVQVLKRPRAAYVEQVYLPHDFGTLNIGT